MGNSCFYEINCLGRSEFLKSAILNGQKVFLPKWVLKRFRKLKIGVFRLKAAVFIKAGV